jgi:hypothetical protein
LTFHPLSGVNPFSFVFRLDLSPIILVSYPSTSSSCKLLWQASGFHFSLVNCNNKQGALLQPYTTPLRDCIKNYECLENGTMWMQIGCSWWWHLIGSTDRCVLIELDRKRLLSNRQRCMHFLTWVLILCCRTLLKICSNIWETGRHELIGAISQDFC